MESQFQEMLELQHQINNKIGGTFWWKNNWNFCRAIWIESAELSEHIGYKWWKDQQFDMKQAQLEIVDIFHFVLSFIIQKDQRTKKNTYTASSLQEKYDNTVACYVKPSDIIYKEVFLSTIDEMVGYLLNDDDILWHSFFNLVLLSGMDINELHKMYVSKNVLNAFRQDNGYNEGTYVKIWNGKEDNEVLVDIVDTLIKTSTITSQSIYSALEHEYAKIFP